MNREEVGSADAGNIEMLLEVPVRERDLNLIFIPSFPSSATWIATSRTCFDIPSMEMVG